MLRNNNNFISGLRSLSQNVSLLRFLALLRRRKNNTTKTLSLWMRRVSFFLFRECEAGGGVGGCERLGARFQGRITTEPPQLSSLAGARDPSHHILPRPLLLRRCRSNLLLPAAAACADASAAPVAARARAAPQRVPFSLSSPLLAWPGPPQALHIDGTTSPPPFAPALSLFDLKPNGCTPLRFLLNKTHSRCRRLLFLALSACVDAMVLL